MLYAFDALLGGAYDVVGRGSCSALGCVHEFAEFLFDLGFVVGDYDSALPGFPDLSWVSVDSGAVCFEHFNLVFVFFGSEACEVAAVCEFGGDLEGELFAASADPDWWVGFL